MRLLSSARNVLRALEILCASAEPLSLAAVATRLDVSEATAYRIIQTLVQHDFVRPAGERAGYQATLRVVELAGDVIDHTEIKDIIRPTFQHVAETFDESVTVAAPDGDHIVFVDRLPALTNVHFYCDVGRRLPLHVGAAARCVLAHLNDEFFDRYLTRPLTRSTPSTKHTPEELRADRKKILTDGYAVSVDEVDVGISAVGVPVVNREGHVLAAVTIANLTVRWSEPEIIERADALLDAARGLSAECAHLTARQVVIPKP
ncbi:MAG: IclR family transcriptional regulator [Streptosporangiaceae bacterium]